MESNNLKGISPEVILKVIIEFYRKAANDFLIGYHFHRIEDFSKHIPKIASFWEIQLNGTSKATGHKFNLNSSHLPLQIRRGQIGRWKVLFIETLSSFEKNQELNTIQRELWQKKMEGLAEKMENFIFSS